MKSLNNQLYGSNDHCKSTPSSRRVLNLKINDSPTLAVPHVKAPLIRKEHLCYLLTFKSVVALRCKLSILDSCLWNILPPDFRNLFVFPSLREQPIPSSSRAVVAIYFRKMGFCKVGRVEATLISSKLLPYSTP